MIALIATPRKYPKLFAAQVVALLIGIPAFISTFMFCMALTPQGAVALYRKPLPPEWTAGVWDHGVYYHWWPIQERPVLFGVSVLFLIAALVFLNGMWAWVPSEWLQDRDEELTIDSKRVFVYKAARAFSWFVVCATFFFTFRDPCNKWLYVPISVAGIIIGCLVSFRLRQINQSAPDEIAG